MAGITLQRARGFSDQQHSAVGPSTGNLYIVNQLGQVTVASADVPYFLAKGWIAPTPGSGPNIVLLDFGAFPGSNFATVTLPDATAPDVSMLLQATVAPIDTADHSADEHVVDGPVVSAAADGLGNIVINGYPNNNVPKIDSMMPWGKWSVAWTSLQ